jgi:hypothetical protein
MLRRIQEDQMFRSAPAERSCRSRTAASILIVGLFFLLGPISAADAGTGTIDITLRKVGLVIGLGRASGTLHFHGRNYPLSISGLSVGTIGIARTHLKGHAYNLRSAADIVGSYTAASVSAAVAGGLKVARLQNSNSSVYLQLEGAAAGLELSVAVGGMTLSLR